MASRNLEQFIDKGRARIRKYPKMDLAGNECMDLWELSGRDVFRVIGMAFEMGVECGARIAQKPAAKKATTTTYNMLTVGQERELIKLYKDIMQKATPEEIADLNALHGHANEYMQCLIDLAVKYCIPADIAEKFGLK